jgi:glycosyltransferase involved in cell wall biosynthesis
VRPALSRAEARLKRLLSIGHSYVVAQNRRLVHEMAVAGAGEWNVTVAAPSRLRGDLRDIELEPFPSEACAVAPLAVRFSGYPHLRFYGHTLRPLLRQAWDVVHCWEEPYVVAAAQIAWHVPATARFVPATFQNIAKQYPAPVAMIERRVMARADGWIAFGETVHETHRDRLGYASKPVRVITPGVDIEAFRPDPAARHAMRERLGWGPHEAVVGFTGRFIEAKGIGTLLEAFARSTMPWNLLFVGGGVMQPDIDRLRARHPSRVRIVTGVAHDDVPAYVNAMDLLCAPSRTTPTWREQFGRMLIEAMACGVPVLASSSGEIPHVLGEAGILVPENDPAAWTSAIERLLSDRSMRGDLSARSVERARSKFAWPVVARAHLDFFAELCAR